MNALPPLLKFILIIPPSGSTAFDDFISIVESSSGSPFLSRTKSTVNSAGGIGRWNFGGLLVRDPMREATDPVDFVIYTLASFIIACFGFDLIKNLKDSLNSALLFIMS